MSCMYRYDCVQYCTFTTSQIPLEYVRYLYVDVAAQYSNNFTFDIGVFFCREISAYFDGQSKLVHILVDKLIKIPKLLFLITRCAQKTTSLGRLFHDLCREVWLCYS